MIKESTYKEKFAMLQVWMPLIIDSVKKDLKNEHLKNDLVFMRHYFPGKNLSKLTSEELAQAYSHAIATGEKTEEVAEFIANRWMLKHSDIYNYFEQELVALNPDFTQLSTIGHDNALKIMNESIKQFGPINTYLFCILNSVVFPEEIYKALSTKADHYAQTQQAEEVVKHEGATLEALKISYEQQIARLTDKYEKKVLGLQKKYTQDVDCLKKQVSALQRKLSAS